MKVLVTGGAGYIGSVICSALEDVGYTPVVLDSLVTGRDDFILNKIFYKGDIGDAGLLKRITSDHPDMRFIIHCAERAAVDQSVSSPYDYYVANVVKSIEMFKTVYDLGIDRVIYSSSASLYEDVPGYMVTETSPINPRSPYARTKYIMEMILRDFCRAYEMKCIALRYFNPIGADPLLRSGIQPKNPHSIVKHLLEVMNGDAGSFVIHGDDWGTRDGTCLRDYVHIWDLALAHVKAVENFENAFIKAGAKDKDFLPLNIGSGIGVTVKEFIFAFENVTREKLSVEIGERRPGDVAGVYANINRARTLIDWEAKRQLEEAILDALRWEEKLKS